MPEPAGTEPACQAAIEVAGPRGLGSCGFGVAGRPRPRSRRREPSGGVVREAPPSGGTPRNGRGPGAGPSAAVELPVQPWGCRLWGRGLARGYGLVLLVCGASGGPFLPPFPLLLQESDPVLRHRSRGRPSCT